jgi:hypothetical protein
MTTTKRKPASKSNVVKLPRPKKPRVPNLTAKMAEAQPLPATRPIMDKASTMRVELELRAAEARDEIAMIDATEAKAEEAHKALIASFDTARDEAIKRIEKAHANNVAVATGNRESEREGMAQLRSEYVEIAARCHAALTVDDAAISAYRAELEQGEGPTQ